MSESRIDQVIRALVKDEIDAAVAPLNAEIDELRKEARRQRWMNRSEAAAYLRCSKATIDHLAGSGQLKKHMLGTKPLFRIEDLDQLVEVTDNEAGEIGE